MRVLCVVLTLILSLCLPFFHFASDWHVRELRGTVCMFWHGNTTFVVHLQKEMSEGEGYSKGYSVSIAFLTRPWAIAVSEQTHTDIFLAVLGFPSLPHNIMFFVKSSNQVIFKSCTFTLQTCIQEHNTFFVFTPLGSEIAAYDSIWVQEKPW